MKDYFRLRHLCLASSDLAKAKEDLPAIFGVPLVYVDPLASDFQVENAIFAFGDSVVEVMAPLGPEAPSARFLRSSGGRGGYLLGFNCSDAQRRAAHFNALGVRTAAEVSYPGFVAWQMHPRDCRAAMIELDHTEGGEGADGAMYAAGGTDWLQRVDTSITRRVLGIVLESPQPLDLAAHWSKLFELPWVAEGAGARIDMEMFPIGFRPAAAGSREAFAGIRIAVREPQAVVTRAQARGYAATDKAVTLLGVQFLLEPAP